MAFGGLRDFVLQFWGVPFLGSGHRPGKSPHAVWHRPTSSMSGLTGSSQGGVELNVYEN